MDYNTLSQFITSVGFPIFVAIWMLYKTSKDSENMQSAIQELKLAITKLTDEMRHHDNITGEGND